MMLHEFEEGPRDQVQAAIEKLDRVALLVLVRSMVGWASYLGFKDWPAMEDVASARKSGRYIALSRRTEKFMQDPSGETRKYLRRKRAAQKAARRRKNASR